MVKLLNVISFYQTLSLKNKTFCRAEPNCPTSFWTLTPKNVFFDHQRKRIRTKIHFFGILQMCHKQKNEATRHSECCERLFLGLFIYWARIKRNIQLTDGVKEMTGQYSCERIYVLHNIWRGMVKNLYSSCLICFLVSFDSRLPPLLSGSARCNFFC